MDVRAAVDALALSQAGAISRRQVLELGVTRSAIAAQLSSGRWSRAGRGVYLTFTGPVPPSTRHWVVSLEAGTDAVLAGASALWLLGVLDRPPEPIRVCLPHGRKAVAIPGAVISASRHLDPQSCPAARPLRMRAEQALLYEVDRAAGQDQVVGLVLQVLQRRATTPERVLLAMRDCGRLRHRPLLRDLLGQVSEGVQSPLELRYRRDVERAHGLPSGTRNRPERVGGTGAPRYRDVRYRGYSLVVELDGEAAHPLELRWRDRLRDNDTALAGDMTLRYGWVEIVTRRCLVAAQVAGGLRRGGWSGEPRGCGPACALGRSSKPLVA